MPILLMTSYLRTSTRNALLGSESRKLAKALFGAGATRSFTELREPVGGNNEVAFKRGRA